jgi:hypothetical protein
VALPPGKVVHIALKKPSLRGSDNIETYFAGITRRPNPNRFYLKIEVANFCGVFGVNLQNILTVGQNIRQ